MLMALAANRIVKLASDGTLATTSAANANPEKLARRGVVIPAGYELAGSRYVSSRPAARVRFLDYRFP
jgi:hypothetical protein